MPRPAHTGRGFFTGFLYMLIEPVGIAAKAPEVPAKPASADNASAAAMARPVAADGAQLEAVVREANRTIAPLASNIVFSVDQESGRTVVKVVDSDTQELIRQIPSPEMLGISHELDRLQGLLLKHKA
jgi:flagellar protein FlaG